MVKKLLNVLFIIIVLADFAFAQNISVEASTDTTAYQVGDYIHLIIKVNAEKNISINGPAVSDTLAGMDLISQRPPQKNEEDSRQSVTYSYTFSKYDSADIVIPPLPVYYKAKGDTAESIINTSSLSFTVRPVKVNVKEDIKDVKEPLKIPLDWKWIALWILIGLILLVTAYYFYRRYQKRKAGYIPEKVVIKIPPHIAALKSLRNLSEKQLWQKGMVKEYHSEITGIIRKYFEERFNLPALEMTSGEAVDELHKRAGTGIIIENTRIFLSNADLVKFAKFQPMASVNEEMMKQAEEIVQKTRQDAKAIPDEVEEDVQ
ncbi:MAG TPA: hypothetical protein VKD08_14350 [Ignavibacteriaceae bacterium]|nr:hypothetical protein [Ignavibacteriaceae bacterium]